MAQENPWSGLIGTPGEGPDAMPLLALIRSMAGDVADAGSYILPDAMVEGMIRRLRFEYEDSPTGFAVDPRKVAVEYCRVVILTRTEINPERERAWRQRLATTQADYVNQARSLIRWAPA